MDFSIFSKPLNVRGLGKSRVDKARERAAARRPASTLELVQKEGGQAAHTQNRGLPPERARSAGDAPAFELSDRQDGLSAALENAALLHASGQSDVARTLLGSAISNDLETRELARAWHAQFDLLQRAGDREAFDHLALEYVTQFESSPPPWDDRRKAVPKAQRTLAGYFAITQLNVKAALEIPARAGRFASLKIDVSTLSVFEELGCRRIVDVLRRLRRQGYPIVFQGLETLKKHITERTRGGSAQNEGLWLLDLEVLQWQGDAQAFDDRAIEYATTFEMSPPAWEPPVPRAESSADTTAVSTQDDIPEAFAMKGTITGPADAQVVALRDFATERPWVQIDMTLVDRVDFVCAGSLQNLLSGFVSARKQVKLTGASPIVEALLLLMGLDPDLFGNRARA